MNRGNEAENFNKYVEATVKALFHSAVAAFYVDVQHDWFHTVRKADKMPPSLPTEGSYSVAIERFIARFIPASYQAILRLKLSPEYIRNHLNRHETEFSLEVPLYSENAKRWFRISVTLIDTLEGLPHHAVISGRDITVEHAVDQARYDLICHLQTKNDKQNLAIEQRNRELFIQNQELANLNKELLESRDSLFELADDLQNALAQNSMYHEMLQMQQAGLIVYDCKTFALLYMNDIALSLYELTEDEFPKLTLQDLRDKIHLMDDTPPISEMPVMAGAGATEEVECSITHADGKIYYVNISYKNVVLSNGHNVVIAVVTDVTRQALNSQKLADKAYSASHRLEAAEGALRHFADYIYHVDLTDGMLVDDFVSNGYLKLLEEEQIPIPCKYDTFIQRAKDLLGLEFISYNGRHNYDWNCDTLLNDFYHGITNCEIEFHHTKTDTYHRITALMAVNPEDCHVVMTAIGTDITNIRKKEYENQRLLLQAQEEAQQASALLEEQQAELELKHQSLETAYMELMEFNSIVQGLQSIFSSCYYIDINQRKFTEIKSNPVMQSIFISSRQMTDSMDVYIHSEVKPKYQKLLEDFMDIDSLSYRLQDKPYITMEYESESLGWMRSYLVPAQYNQSSQPTHVLYVNEIIEEEKVLQNHLRKVAETDGLTGILNRASGERKIISQLNANRSGAFGILDCDDFKGINDNYGHGIGDKVLIMVAHSLTEAMGAENIVLRLGGDEFAFYLIDCNCKRQLSSMVTKFFTILDSIHIPQLKDRKVTVSVGAVLYDGKSGKTFDELYEIADHNLYESKKLPSNRLTI